MNINPYSSLFTEIKRIDELTEEERKSGDWEPLDSDKEMWGKLQKSLRKALLPIKDVTQDDMKAKLHRIEKEIKRRKP